MVNLTVGAAEQTAAVNNEVSEATNSAEDRSADPGQFYSGMSRHA